MQSGSSGEWSMVFFFFFGTRRMKKIEAEEQVVEFELWREQEDSRRVEWKESLNKVWKWEGGLEGIL